MLVLVDRDQLRELGERLADSFAEGRTEIIGAAVLLGGALVALILYAIHGRGHARRVERRAHRKRYRTVVTQASLTEVERKALDGALRVARAERVSPARLVTQASAFDRVAERMLTRGQRDAERGRGRSAGGPPLETTLSALRVKLRAHRPALGNVRSTTDLPNGAPALVKYAGGCMVGRIGKHRPRALSVRIGGGGDAPELAERTPVEVAVPLSSGLYRARTVVLWSDATILLLAHRERLGRTQRRAWARGRAGSHAWWVMEAGEGNAHLFTLTEVGGGGATGVRVAQKGAEELKIGDCYLVRIFGLPMAVAAKVVRISRRGVHLAFGQLRDSERDRLIRLALAGQRKSVASSSSAGASRPSSAAASSFSREESAPIVTRRIAFSSPTR